MSDPAFKTYTDRYFVTKEALDRRINNTAKTIGETMGDVLKPHINRLDLLDAQGARIEAAIAQLEATLAGMKRAARMKP